MREVLKPLLSHWAAWQPRVISQLHEGHGESWGKGLWRNWDWRPEVILVLVILGVVYSLGWRRLRRSGHRRLASGWRLLAYLGGLGVLGLALLSPIDTLQPFLFSVHMVQHELLMMVVPPLLLLAAPFPIALWGLPSGLRRAVCPLLTRRAPFRRGLSRATGPWMAWVLYVATLWLWHTPGAYDAALHDELIHDVEHISFFATALLFWWHVTGAAPRIHGALGYGWRIGYVLAALAQNEILAVGISLASQPLYTYYTTVPRLWSLSVLEDQMLGGAIMWIPGGMMYALTAVILIGRLLDREEERMRHSFSAQPAARSH